MQLLHIYNVTTYALGRNGGVFNEEEGHGGTDVEPGTKLDGSFISIHRPSNLTFL